MSIQQRVSWGRVDRLPRLVFQATGNRENFQGRYVLRHPWTGAATCDEAKRYRADLLKRLNEQATTLSGLTGWPRSSPRQRVTFFRVVMN